MRQSRLILSGAVLVAVISWAPLHARAACDAGGADAADLESTYEAIETFCPCDGPSRRDYRACAKNRIANEIAEGSLRAECRQEAFRYSRYSRCGKPGAVVCCRIDRNGKERHRAPIAGYRCDPLPGGTACESQHNSVVTGCDASGCVPLAVCGNGVQEDGEECDPPNGTTCDESCQQIGCEDVPSLCGNGVVDAGEGCEPPGTATCDRTCQAVACGSAPSGESTLACLDAAATVEVASNGEGFLAVWNVDFVQERPDVLARRLDEGGAPLEPAPIVLSENLQCRGQDVYPAVGSDGTDYAVSWLTYGELPSDPAIFTHNVYTRGVLGEGGASGGPILLASILPVGSCRSSLTGPTAVASGPGSAFTVLHREVLSCFPGGQIAEMPKGTILPLPAGTPRTDFSLDPFTTPPQWIAGDAASADALGADTLAAWPADGLVSQSPLVTISAIRAAWVDAGSRPHLTLGEARWASRADVAAGAASFLVSFAARADDEATDATQIRAFRVTRAAGALDPAFGLAIATTSTEITSGPVAAFDGEVWLVAWVEVSGGGHDLRAAAVRPDGSIVDATSRLLAAGVSNAPPALASTGDGSVLVLFTRPAAGGKTALNTMKVEGS
jgi:hypothetical protein